MINRKCINGVALTPSAAEETRRAERDRRLLEKVVTPATMQNLLGFGKPVHVRVVRHRLSPEQRAAARRRLFS